MRCLTPRPRASKTTEGWYLTLWCWKTISVQNLTACIPQVQTQSLGWCCPRQPHTPGSMSERRLWLMREARSHFVEGRLGNHLCWELFKGNWNKSGTIRPAPSQQSKSKSKNNHYALILVYLKNIFSERWRDGSVCKALDVLELLKTRLASNFWWGFYLQSAGITCDDITPGCPMHWVLWYIML